MSSRLIPGTSAVPNGKDRVTASPVRSASSALLERSDANRKGVATSNSGLPRPVGYGSARELAFAVIYAPATACNRRGPPGEVNLAAHARFVEEDARMQDYADMRQEKWKLNDRARRQPIRPARSEEHTS